jgi:hypothetical protein
MLVEVGETMQPVDLATPEDAQPVACAYPDRNANPVEATNPVGRAKSKPVPVGSKVGKGLVLLPWEGDL